MDLTEGVERNRSRPELELGYVADKAKEVAGLKPE